MEQLRGYSKGYHFRAAASMILGAALLVWPSTSMQTFCYTLGAVRCNFRPGKDLLCILPETRMESLMEPDLGGWNERAGISATFVLLKIAVCSLSASVLYRCISADWRCGKASGRLGFEASGLWCMVADSSDRSGRVVLGGVLVANPFEAARVVADFNRHRPFGRRAGQFIRPSYDHRSVGKKPKTEKGRAGGCDCGGRVKWFQGKTGKRFPRKSKKRRRGVYMKILFISLGCDKNLGGFWSDAGTLSEKRGYSMTDDEAEADIIIVNTCCFIGDAKEEGVNTILDTSEYKKQGSCKALIVTGCMAQRYKKEIQEEIPEVDAILGTNSYDKILDAVDEALAGHQHVRAVQTLWDFQRWIQTGSLTTGGHYAYLTDRRRLQQTLHLLHHSFPSGKFTGASPWKNWWSRHRNLQKKESKS